MKLLETVFSLKNKNNHKILTILGFKIKLKLDLAKRETKRIQKKYKNILKKLKEKQKINVVFLVNENSKWKLQSVYDEFSSNKKYNTKVLLSIADYDVYCSKEHRKNKLYQNLNFFKKRNIKAELAWDLDNDTAIDIKIFEPDVIFYQVPYNISANQDIDYVSNFALCVYIPYYINQSEDFQFMGTQNWHKKLFRFYVLNDYWKKITAKKLGASKNIKAVHHPFFDNYHNTKNNGDYVVYAAHWSVGLEDGLSSFLETGYFMLNYAKMHPEINWAFTHHPTLIFNVVDKGYMSQSDIDNYINEWKKFSYFPPDGDYMELFNSSKCLISDCGSFRVEYFPTGNPYIYLISNNKKRLADGNFIKKLTKHYYKAHNVRELKEHLDNVLLKNIDPFSNERKSESYAFTSINSAKRIVEDLEQQINCLK